MFAIQNKTNSALLQFGKTFNVLIDILIYIYIYLDEEKCENTKGVIRICKSKKDRQHNG